MTAVVLVAGTGQALAYGYRYTFPVADRADANTTFGYVNSHFREVFPLAAPDSSCGEHLTVGEVCDLVGWGRGKVRVEEVGSRHFVLRSLPGHVEGANKVINFTLYNDGPALRLSVTASGKDNFLQKLPFAKRVNRLFAQNAWSNFAVRIGNLVRSGAIAAT